MSCQLHSHLPKKESKRQETTTLKSYHQLTSVVDTAWHQQLTGIKHGVAHETPSLKTHTQAPSNMVLLMKHPPWKHTHRHHQTWCCSWNTSLKTHTQAPSNMVLLMKHLPENTHTGTIKHGVAHETPPWKHTHRHHKHGVAHETSSLKTHTQALSNMVLLMKHLPENTHTGTIKQPASKVFL